MIKLQTVEAVLLKDSALGEVGKIVSVDKAYVETYIAQNMIDIDKNSIAYAKTQPINT